MVARWAGRACPRSSCSRTSGRPPRTRRYRRQVIQKRKRREDGGNKPPHSFSRSKKKKKTRPIKTQKQSIRKLALDLAASSAPSFEGLRAVYRSLGVAKGIDRAPSLEEALSGVTKKKNPKTDGTEAKTEARANENKTKPKPRDPALAARLQALQDASDQRSYDACVADLTESERAASRKSGSGLSSTLAGSASAAGLALAASAGTGYAAGFVAAKALFPDEAKHPIARFIGGLVGLVAAVAVEVGLVIVRAVRAENDANSSSSSSSSFSSSSMPKKITQRLTDAELAAEAEVARAVVAGAAAAMEAGAEAKAAEAAARVAAEELAAVEGAAAATADDAKKQR